MVDSAIVALDRYGVLVGTLVSHQLDEPDRQGRWFHVTLLVDAGGQQHRCAVDVDSELSSIGVEWRTATLTAADLGPVLLLAEGYHDLAPTPSSGAVDCIRSRWLAPPPGCAFSLVPEALTRLRHASVGGEPPWMPGWNLDVAAALEPLLAGRPEILVFGAPSPAGPGMHDIHQNQGDPPASPWEAQNGPWQDGAVVVRRPEGRFAAFVTKFSSQAKETDASGRQARGRASRGSGRPPG